MNLFLLISFVSIVSCQTETKVQNPQNIKLELKEIVLNTNQIDTMLRPYELFLIFDMFHGEDDTLLFGAHHDRFAETHKYGQFFLINENDTLELYTKCNQVKIAKYDTLRLVGEVDYELLERTYPTQIEKKKLYNLIINSKLEYSSIAQDFTGNKTKVVNSFQSELKKKQVIMLYNNEKGEPVEYYQPSID